MTDIEKYNELESKIQSLIKERDEIKDTVQKSDLSKNRFRFIDYKDLKYWIKILSVGECECEVLIVYSYFDSNSINISRRFEKMDWLCTGIPTVEEIFNAKFDEYLNKIKL